MGLPTRSVSLLLVILCTCGMGFPFAEDTWETWEALCEQQPFVDGDTMPVELLQLHDMGAYGIPGMPVGNAADGHQACANYADYRAWRRGS